MESSWCGDEVGGDVTRKDDRWMGLDVNKNNNYSNIR